MAFIWKWTRGKIHLISSELKQLFTVQGSNITEEVKHFEEELEKNGISGLRRKVQEDLDRWKNISVNFAVIGSTGQGKSSFINALINVSESHEGAAVGIKETTTKLQAYRYPKNPNIVLYDLPGVGTKNFPKARYLQDVKIDRYDCFFLITNNRFTEDESWIADEIRKRGKQFYFVRTAIDSTIESEKKRRKKFKQSAPDEDVLCEEVRKACAENLDEHSNVFLVDNFDDEAYDFPKIRERLLDDLPEIKTRTLILSFSALTVKVLDKKRNNLLKDIPKVALQITTTKDDCEQKRLFREAVISYQKQFELDDVTLKENIDILSYTKENIEDFNIVFDREMAGDKGIFSVTPTKKRENASVWSRFLDLFATKENKLIYRFCVCGLSDNLAILYQKALELHGKASSNVVAKECVKSDP